jgi:hypothetical protein
MKEISIPIGTPLREAIREVIRQTVELVGSREVAAQVLKCAPKTIYNTLGGTYTRKTELTDGRYRKQRFDESSARRLERVWR